MKNSFKKSLALLLAAVMLFGASPIIGIDFSTPASAASESNLTFELINGDTEYMVSDCDEAAEGELTIPATYNGKPVTSIDFMAFYRCISLTNITIPNSVTSIGHSAFLLCTSIASIAIPASVTSIGEQAFHSCIKLESVTFAEGSKLESISNYAFTSCSSLESITIPDSVTSIGSSAFYGCVSLESVTINERVTSIGLLAFSACYDLKEIIVAESNPNYSSENGVLFNKTKTKLIQYPIGKADIAYTIPDGVVEIGNSAFEACNLETFVIPASVEFFGEDAIDECDKLKTITVDEGNAVFSSQDGVLFNKDKTVLYKYPASNERTTYSVPERVIEIVADAFNSAKNLTTVNLPDGLKSIGSHAFNACLQLDSLSIPLSVESIGQYAFYYIRFYQNATNWEDGLLYLDGWLIDVDEANTQVNIKAGTRGVSDYAAEWCNSVESVVIPTSVETIGEAAFSGLSNLASITVDSNNPNYCAENNVLFNKDKTELIVMATKTAPTAYTIPDSVTSIAVDAFFRVDNLADITIPDSVESIGSWAFDETAFYKNIYNWSDDVLYLNNCLLASANNDENIVIRPDTRVIADDAFESCKDLKEVLMPDSVKHIGKWAFENCSNLTSITITNPATTIGEFAFYGVADDFVIKGCSGSAAETYANENNIAFEAVSFPVTGITLDITSKTLEIGKTQQLAATVAPTNATNKAVTYTSSDEKVATVSATGLVTAISAGTATITVTTADGNKTATCTITVISPTVSINNNPGTKTINYGDELKLTAAKNNAPDGAVIVWYVDGTEKGRGDEFTAPAGTADYTVTVKIVDKDGNIIKDAENKEITAEENVTVKAGFFQKLINFFKNLFGASRIVPQAFKEF